MKTVMLTLSVLAVTVSGAFAASVTNKDSDVQVLVVTEGGVKREVAVDAGAKVEICPSGCFITMPSGDRETLSGPETLDIVGGSAVIK
ncbi:hypothetical protein E2A64_10565 [Pseudohoeflea suaedae]|uniref:Uncharacterized protein n=1 Tax=Pseudohoeflea suaedae TaxID=877384 RepID=A0A4R5PKL3_9HYPH|nr:hypothetical protein [Pseudohoeflea suaedae]TDH35764.1 hypothetical protein E2A64_10565 [Pseudohoeflea suaedae]